MSRYTGPTTRINRRFGMALFPANKAFERRSYPPGQHGPSFRRKVDYGQGLIEKQKLRMMYGLTEKQFRNMFERAKRKKGVTGEVFLTMLETRLDNVVYRLVFAKTRQAARQFVNHGHLLVNGKKVDIPSYFVVAGDVIGVREKTSSRQVATKNLEGSQYHPAPPWVDVNVDSLQGTVSRLPQADELEQSVNVQLVVEFYSR
jgi:small subunit ribosomal protein S4